MISKNFCNRGLRKQDTEQRPIPIRRSIARFAAGARLATRRREDDHLCLVAGTSKLQIDELTKAVDTTQGLAEMPLPLELEAGTGVADAYARVREQARLQVEARGPATAAFELLPWCWVCLTRLPNLPMATSFSTWKAIPSWAAGLEYLFGYLYR